MHFLNKIIAFELYKNLMGMRRKKLDPSSHPPNRTVGCLFQKTFPSLLDYRHTNRSKVPTLPNARSCASPSRLLPLKKLDYGK